MTEPWVKSVIMYFPVNCSCQTYFSCLVSLTHFRCNSGWKKNNKTHKTRLLKSRFHRWLLHLWMDITTIEHSWADDILYGPREQNCVNISVSLSKYDGAAIFYMASVNSRSSRELESSTFSLWGTSFMHALFTHRGPKTWTSANYANMKSRSSKLYLNLE